MSLNIDFDITGLDDLQSAVDKGNRTAVNRAMPRALTEEAQIILRNSLRIVPVDSGTLRRSGAVGGVETRGQVHTITIGYGGAASSYALEQHENLFYSHKSGKQAKYLSTPAEARQDDFVRNLRKRLERIMFQ